MQMPVIVGVFLAIIFLVSFSEWFYHMVIGWGEIVLDDIYFKYRIVGITAFSFVIVGVTFFVMAVVNECPSEERTDLFSGINCEEYKKIKTGAERFIGIAAEDEVDI